MAARVIVDHLGLDLYRVDLVTVVSKYIAETEKSLLPISTFYSSMRRTRCSARGRRYKTTTTATRMSRSPISSSEWRITSASPSL
jgi:hypothetical protein